MSQQGLPVGRTDRSFIAWIKSKSVKQNIKEILTGGTREVTRPEQFSQRIGEVVTAAVKRFEKPSADRRKATEDLLWALINTPEFVFNEYVYDDNHKLIIERSGEAVRGTLQAFGVAACFLAAIVATLAEEIDRSQATPLQAQFCLT
mgnify:CR=1 FL=1